MGVLAVSAAVTVLTATAADHLGLPGLRFGMSQAAVQAAAPTLQPLTASRSFDLRTAWVLGGHVLVDSHCLDLAEVGGDDRGLSDIDLQLTKGDVGSCAIAARDRLQARYGAAKVQQNGSPAVPSTYYDWSDGQQVHIEVSHFFGGGRLTYLVVRALDSSRSPFMVR